MTKQVCLTLQEKIRNLRAKMLIHSYLYYELNEPIISDSEFDVWAKELASIKWMKIKFYDEAFKDWTGETGYHLPRDLWVEGRARYLLKTHEKQLI